MARTEAQPAEGTPKGLDRSGRGPPLLPTRPPAASPARTDGLEGMPGTVADILRAEAMLVPC